MKRVTLVADGRVFVLDVGETQGELQVHLDGEPIGAEVGKLTEGGLSVLLGDRSYEAQAWVRERQILVELEGERFVFELNEGSASRRGPRGEGSVGKVEVKAPMPGKVVRLFVSAGDRVEAGQGVLLFEAMKMQNEIRSPLAGAIDDLPVQEGQAVESREALFTVKSEVERG